MLSSVLRHLAEFSHPSIHHGGLRTSENCLMLNIYQPVDMISSESIPIVLWVPGDGYSFADSIQYDGSALATKGKVIVITMNYRVGELSFEISMYFLFLDTISYIYVSKILCQVSLDLQA